MKKIIITLLLLCGIAYGQIYQVLPQRYEFKDSVKLFKLKNNPAGDSILATDQSGRLIQVLKQPGGGSTDTANLSYRIDTTSKWVIGDGWVNVTRINDSLIQISFNQSALDSAIAAGGGGGSTDTTSLSNRINVIPTKLNYIPKVKKLLPYNWYIDSTWSTPTNNNDYYSSGITASVVSGKVELTGSANNYSAVYYKLSKYLSVEYWETVDTFKIVNAISSTTRGLSIGVGTNYFVVGDIDLSTGVNAGQLAITVGQNTATWFTAATSAGAISFLQGDTLVATSERIYDLFTFAVKNIRTGETQTVSYNTSPLLLASSDYWFVFGGHSFFNRGTGTYRLISSTAIITDSTNRGLGILGDSKIQGIHNGATANRISDKIAAQGYDIDNFGVSGAAIYDFFQPKYLDMIFAMNVKTLILSVGSNDVRQSRTWATIFSDYKTLVGILNQRGVKVYHICIWEQNKGAELATLDSFLKVTYPDEYIAEVWTATKVLGLTGLASDGVHQNAIGADTVAQNILRAGMLTKSEYLPNQQSNWTGIGQTMIKDSANIVSKLGDNTGTVTIGSTDNGILKFKIAGRTIMETSWNKAVPQWSFKNYANTEIASLHLDSLFNVKIGKLPGYNYTSGASNIFIGNEVGGNNGGNGTRNIGIGGYSLGAGRVGQNLSDNIAIGYSAGYYESRNYKFYLGQAASGNEALLHGDFATGQLIVNPANLAAEQQLTASAQFEVRSTDKGLLIPRITTTARDAISSPATSLLIYNTTIDSFQYYKSGWKTLGGGTGGSSDATKLDTGGNYLKTVTLVNTNVIHNTPTYSYNSATHNYEITQTLATQSALTVLGTVAGGAPSFISLDTNFIGSFTAKVLNAASSKANTASPTITGLLTVTGTTQTGSSAIGAVDIAQTWNTTGNPTGIKFNVTNTASGASSLLADLQVGGTSQFKVSKAGAVTANSTITSVSSFSGYAYTANNTNGSNPQTGLLINGSSITSTSGTINNGVSMTQGFAPTSGTAAFTAFNYSGTINQTGGASGIVRMFYSNPTITAGADVRGLEIAAGKVYFSATNTASGTTGAQTINKISGKVNFAAGATTLVVTNSLVTTSSIVDVTVYGTDATFTNARVTLASGSFTITANAAATAETAVSFIVIN